MSQDRDTNLALFIDFDNVALGARDARKRFDVNTLLQRILEKGKIIVKKAYADWHYYKEHMSPLHEAAIELIEIPMPRISGKNSADIKLVVDAMDLCYSKDHIDTFVIVSGDSDFSPLVSKLRENNKRVIGIGVKNSSSHLLIGNCDEFIFYDDIYRNAVGQAAARVRNVPADKRELFDFLVTTVAGPAAGEPGGPLLLADQGHDDPQAARLQRAPSATPTSATCSRMPANLGLLVVERDARAGGTWVVQGLAKGVRRRRKKSRRRRRRRPGRGAGGHRGGGRRRRSRGRIRTSAGPGAEAGGKRPAAGDDFSAPKDRGRTAKSEPGSDRAKEPLPRTARVRRKAPRADQEGAGEEDDHQERRRRRRLRRPRRPRQRRRPRPRRPRRRRLRRRRPPPRKPPRRRLRRPRRPRRRRRPRPRRPPPGRLRRRRPRPRKRAADRIDPGATFERAEYGRVTWAQVFLGGPI